MDALQTVRINANPLVPAPSPLVAGTSSTQPQRRCIARLSQCAASASATTSTVAIGDLDEEEPWVSPSDSNSESEPDDVSFSSDSD